MSYKLEITQYDRKFCEVKDGNRILSFANRFEGRWGCDACAPYQHPGAAIPSTLELQSSVLHVSTLVCQMKSVIFILDTVQRLKLMWFTLIDIVLAVSPRKRVQKVYVVGPRKTTTTAINQANKRDVMNFFAYSIHVNVGLTLTLVGFNTLE